MSQNGKPRSRWRRRAGLAGLALALLALVVIVVLRARFAGDRLATTVESMLSDSVRGRVEIGSVDWPVGDLTALVTGGWVRVTVRDLEVYDEFDELVLSTPLATGEIDLYPALLDQDIVVRDLRLPDGGYALIKEVREPYPAHQYDDSAVSLVSAFYTKRAPSFHAGITAGDGSVFDLQDYHIAGATLEFRFPDFTAIAEDVHGDGFLYYDGSDPIAGKLFYSLTPKARLATVTIGEVAIVLDDLDVERLAQVPTRWPREMVPRDLVYRATATSGGTARVRLDGKMLDSWIDIFGGDHDITLRVDHAGDLASLLSDGVAGGDDLELELTVNGPSLAPRVGLRIAALELALDVGADERLELFLEHASAGFDTATETGTVDDTVATGAGGKVELAASFQLDPMSFDLRIDILDGIELGPYLSPTITELTGSELSGHLHAFGNQEIQRLGDLDLKLGDARVTGEAYRTAEGVIHADDVDVQLRGTRVADLTGQIDVGTGALDLDFSVVSGDVRRWLRHFRAPAMARSLRGKVSLEGTLAAPEARASVVARGVPVVDRLDADLRYAGDVLTVRELQSSAFGGWVRGSAALGLGGTPRIRAAEAQVVNVDLSKLPVIGAFLGGELDIEASAGGALGNPRASATATLAGWSVAGEAYEDAEIALEAAPDGTRNLTVTLERILGGVLHLDARLGQRGQLGGAVSVRGLPVDGLLALEDGQTMGGGALSAELQLGGSISRPTADGQMSLLRSWIGDSFLGTAELDIDTTEDGRIALRGKLFQDRIVFGGTLSPVPPFNLEATASVRRVELDRFAPDVAARYGVRGWISGDLGFRGPLLAAAGAPEITARLTEAVLLLENEDELGRPAPIRVRNQSPVSLSYDGARLALDEPAVFEGPTGDFTASGSVGDEGYDLGLSGTVAIALLEPYLQQHFEDMSGTLDIEARLTGPLGATPRVTGVVEIESVALKPTGQDATVTIPAGKIDFSNDQLALTGLSMVVVDEFSDERSELQVAGGVRLDDFRPNLWAIRVDGQLAGKMLLAVAPQYFSAASGSADVSVALLGVGEVPDIDGTIEFSPEAPLAITPRGLRRELVFTGGLVRFTDQLVELDKVRGWVDDEGQITDVSGEISLDDWQPVDVDVSVSARDLPFRVPGELELTLNLRELQVIGGVDSRLELAGEIEVVDGRYVRKFNPVIDALRPARSIESSAPFYEGIPLLANARLSLVLATRSFFVKNNVADIHLSGEVEVTGTPSSPRFAGVVRVEQGSFKFQGVRAKFERTTGSVSFSPYRKFPENTPTLDLHSESNYRDISGQDHLVQLSLRGPLSHLNWDLTTGSGLNKGQTLTLIFAGRTPDDVRETLLGDQAIGRGAGDFEGSRSTASSDNTFQAADQLVKDLAGDFFSLLIEDRLRDVTGLDVARLQVGTASVGFHGEKNITKSIRSVLEFERTLRGWSWDARGEYRINDTVSLDGEVNQKKYDDDAEEDQDQLKFKATWRFLVP